MAGQYGKLVNKQFNSPIKLYSDNNIREVLDREAQLLANGAVGINFNNPMAAKPANLQHSAVLRFLEEEEQRKRGGSPNLKRVAWPPPAEAEGHLTEISLQDLGGPQISSPGLQNNQAPSANYQEQGQERPQLSNQHQPVVASPYKPTHQVAPLSPSFQPSPLSPLSNTSPAGFSPVHTAKQWAPVQSPSTVSPQPKYPSAPQQYQPPPQQYQPPPQQYQPPPQQYQPPPQQYQPPSQQYQPAPQQYQPPPQQYQPPPQQYQPPPQQYQPPPQQYQPPPQQYQEYRPAQQYQPPPQQYQPPPQQYQSPPQQYQPPSQPKPIQQSQTTQTYSQPSTPQQPIAQPQFQAAPTAQPELAQQQQQPPTQAAPPQQQHRFGGVPPQQQKPIVPQPSVKPAKVVEPPPATITLRPEAPVSQAPAPLIASQPATATLKGGKNLRGDLKWPPPETKQRMEAENQARIEIARGPVCRPRKVNRDYSGFFAQHALNSTYPGYKVPPGTQFYVQERSS